MYRVHRNRQEQLSSVYRPAASLYLLSLVEQKLSSIDCVQYRLLHIHAIFGLVEHDGVRSIQNFVGNLGAAVRRKTVHENGAWRGEFHELAIDLVRLKNIATDFFFGFKAHAGPGIGID